MIQIDLKKCIGCGACVKDCPGKAIQITDGNAVPVKKCILCGHCVALCPERAVSIPEYDMADVEEYDPQTFYVAPENDLHALKFRRSIRNFKEQPIEREKMERILETGRYTATGVNCQDCRFILVQDQLKEFKDLVWQEIPAIIGHLQQTDPAWHYMFSRFYERYQKDPCNDTFFFNCMAFLVIGADDRLGGGLAASNIENMAVAEGAGVLYSGYMMRMVNESTRLREWLGLEQKQVACCMLMGYPNVKYLRTAPHRKADILWK